MSKRTVAISLVLVVILGIVVVALPVFLIMPFKSQTPFGVGLSFTLRRWSPLVTLATLVTGLALIATLWRGSRPWLRVLALIALVPLGVATWFARQNHFEWMFKPLPGVNRTDLAHAGFVKPGDMVLGVVSNGVAMAYPVNQVAYHHVVNDTLGGVPIIATY
jgi:hypothetical protein